MKISVITASYNSQATIGATIESFLAQTHPDKEMLVVDGASKDATLKIVESFGSSDIRVISEPDKGVYDAMNKGLHLFKGDAIGFLNSTTPSTTTARWRRSRRRWNRPMSSMATSTWSPITNPRPSCAPGVADTTVATRFSSAGFRRIRPLHASAGRRDGRRL